MQAQAKLYVFSEKLIEYNLSALSVYSSRRVGRFPRIKISFFLLSVFVDDLISTPKIITFLPTPFPNEKLQCLPNPIP